MDNRKFRDLISSIVLDGANKGEFRQTNNCPSSLASGKGCTISVTMTPNGKGSKSAVLGIASNDPRTPALNIELKGSGR